jgi:type I restriction enzyme R subunit
MTAFTESVVEDAALAWLEALGCAVLHGPDIAAGEPGATVRSGRPAVREWGSQAEPVPQVRRLTIRARTYETDY